MWKVTRKGLAAHKVRFLLTALAVLISVAFMAGTSVLTVSTKKNVSSGTYLLTVTGTAGNRVHSASITLVVR